MANNGSETVNIKTLGTVLGVVLALGGAVYGISTGIATKSDFKELESRVRAVERSIDRFFGKAAVPSASVESSPGVVFAASPSEPRRTVAVTKEFIADHKLQPSGGGSYLLLGEDGRMYSLDDVLAALIREHKQHK